MSGVLAKRENIRARRTPSRSRASTPIVRNARRVARRATLTIPPHTPTLDLGPTSSARIAPPPARSRSMRPLPSSVRDGRCAARPAGRGRAAPTRPSSRPGTRRRRDAADRRARPRPLAHAVASCPPRKPTSPCGSRTARLPGGACRRRPRAWTLHVPGESPRPVTADRMTWVPLVLPAAGGDAQPRRTRPCSGWPTARGRPSTASPWPATPRSTLPRSVSDLDSDEARTLLDALQQTFNREERLMLAQDYFAVFQPSVRAEDRDRMPVRALSIHAGPGHGGPTYFVELIRSYPRRRPGTPALVRRSDVHVGLGASSRRTTRST